MLEKKLKKQEMLEIKSGNSHVQQGQLPTQGKGSQISVRSHKVSGMGVGSLNMN
jgi:hypothetical protein